MHSIVMIYVVCVHAGVFDHGCRKKGKVVLHIGKQPRFDKTCTHNSLLIVASWLWGVVALHYLDENPLLCFLGMG